MEDKYKTAKKVLYTAMVGGAIGALASCQPQYETMGFCENQNLSDSSALEKTLDVDSTKLSESKKSDTTSYAFKE